MLSELIAKDEQSTHCYYFVHYARRWVISNEDVSLAREVGESSVLSVILKLLQSEEQ